MDVAEVREYCLAKPGAWLDDPFHENHPLAKVGHKIFCFWGADPLQLTAKNTRSAIAEWRARYPAHAGPAAYLHKELWNRVLLGGPDGPGPEEMHELVDDSYELVLASLPRAKRPT